MSIIVKCSGCQRLLRLKDEHAGKRFTCPACKGVVVVPPPVLDAEQVGGVERHRQPAAKASAMQVTCLCLNCGKKIQVHARFKGSIIECPVCKNRCEVAEPMDTSPLRSNTPSPPAPLWKSVCTWAAYAIIGIVGLMVISVTRDAKTPKAVVYFLGAAGVGLLIALKYAEKSEFFFTAEGNRTKLKRKRQFASNEAVTLVYRNDGVTKTLCFTVFDGDGLELWRRTAEVPGGETQVFTRTYNPGFHSAVLLCEDIPVAKCSWEVALS